MNILSIFLHPGASMLKFFKPIHDRIIDISHDPDVISYYCDILAKLTEDYRKMVMTNLDR